MMGRAGMIKTESFCTTLKTAPGQKTFFSIETLNYESYTRVEEIRQQCSSIIQIPDLGPAGKFAKIYNLEPQYSHGMKL